MAVRDDLVDNGSALDWSLTDICSVLASGIGVDLSAGLELDAAGLAEPLADLSIDNV